MVALKNDFIKFVLFCNTQFSWFSQLQLLTEKLSHENLGPLSGVRKEILATLTLWHAVCFKLLSTISTLLFVDIMPRTHLYKSLCG